MAVRCTVLHEFIVANRDEILRRTAEGLAGRAPKRSQVELLDHLPAFLDETVAALKADAGLEALSPLPGRSFTAIELADQRANLGLDIEVLTRGFGLLCDSVAGLADEQSVTIPPREFQILNRCIDAGIATAISAFLERQLGDQERLNAERVGSIAHELRNSLASTMMAFSILRDGQVGISSRTGDVMARGLDRMRTLVENMLVDVQLRSPVALNPTEIDLAPLLEELVAGTFAERGVVVTARIEPGLTLVADLRLLTSAVINLVQNGVKFTRKGGRVDLRAWTADDAVVIEVEDECGGLPDGDPYRLLEPFTQDAADRRGIGLGLSITRDAVRAHGGDITIRDRPGRGCVFSLRFPARPQPSRVAPPFAG